MSDLVRQAVIAAAHTVVVKVGTNVLARPDGTLDPARFTALADQIQRVRQSGRKVALVSSGAIGAGVGTGRSAVGECSLLNTRPQSHKLSLEHRIGGRTDHSPDDD